MKYYEIAELLLGSPSESVNFFDAFCRHDLTDMDIPCDLKNNIQRVDKIEARGTLIHSSPIIDAYIEDGISKIYYKTHFLDGSTELSHENRLSDDFSVIDSFILNKNKTDLNLYGLLYEFSACLLKHNGMVFHSSAIEYKDEAVIFTAKSGVGKSTHTRYWKKCFRALILNGDTPAVRKTDGGVYVYGIPWCGTSGEFIDRKTPLKAVVLLRRGTENKCYKVPYSSVLGELYNQVVFPYWLGSVRIETLNILDNLFKDIDIYVMECTKSEDAAYVARDVIYG